MRAEVNEMQIAACELPLNRAKGANFHWILNPPFILRLVNKPPRPTATFILHTHKTALGFDWTRYTPPNVHQPISF